MRRASAASALAFAALVASGCHGERAGTVRLPDLYGRQYRDVQEFLASHDLRWRFFGSERVWTEPPPPNSFSTADDDLVVEQYPDPGARLRPGDVVQLKTSCTLEPLPEDVVCID